MVEGSGLPDNLQGVIVMMVVDTHHEHGGISAGGGDDDPLGTSLQVSLLWRLGLEGKGHCGIAKPVNEPSQTTFKHIVKKTGMFKSSSLEVKKKCSCKVGSLHNMPTKIIMNARQYPKLYKNVTMAFLLLVNWGTYRGLVDGGEHTSRLNNVVSASVTPLDLGRVPPEDGKEMGEVRIKPQNQG